MRPTLERRSSGKAVWPGSIAIAVTGLIVYAGSFDGALLFDDAAHIVQNERIKDLTALGTVLSGTRPIVDLSLAANYGLHQLRVPGYHAVNVFVHVLAALVLYATIRRTLLLGSSEDDRNHVRHTERAKWLSLISSLIWLVHPIQTQSVTYVIQRAEAMMALFYLSTLYCVIRGATQRATGPATRRWYMAAVACCALGMGCKAVMVTAPLVVLLYDIIFLSRGALPALRRRWALYVGLAGSWIVLWLVGIAGGVLSKTNPGAHLGFGYKDITPAQYAFTQFGVIAHYIRLAIWPAPLCLDHNWPVASSLSSIAPPALLIALLGTLSLLGVLRRSWLGFAGASFFLILAPTSSIVPIKDPMFEHRMYLPLCAIIALIVICSHRLLSLLCTSLAWSRRVERMIGAGATIIFVLSLGVCTAVRNDDYESLITMWTDVTHKNPRNARAFEHLGTANMMRGQRDQAIAAYAQAVKLDANYTSAHSNLANVLLESGRAIEAERHYRQVLKLDPKHVEAGMNLGQSLKAQKRLNEAIEQFRATTMIKPTKRNSTLLARTFVNLGSAIGNGGDIDGAIAAYRESIRLWPEYANGHALLGQVLLGIGERREAIEHLRRALQINPLHRRARQDLDRAVRQ